MVTSQHRVLRVVCKIISLDLILLFKNPPHYRTCTHKYYKTESWAGTKCCTDRKAYCADRFSQSDSIILFIFICS